MCDFFVVGDFDLVLLGVVLLPCEVAGVGIEMWVRGVAPGGDEGVLRCHYFGVVYYRPRAEMSDK